MWIPKINYLDRVKHKIVKTKIINKIKDKNLTIDDIAVLNRIVYDDFVIYELILNDNTFFKYCSDGFEFDEIIKKGTDSDEIYIFNALLSKYGPEGLYLIADKLKEIADEDVRCSL